MGRIIPTYDRRRRVLEDGTVEFFDVVFLDAPMSSRAWCYNCAVIAGELREDGEADVDPEELSWIAERLLEPPPPVKD